MEELSERLAIVETKVEDHSRILEKQQEQNIHQVELNTLTKMFIEESKETRKQMQKFDDTLVKVNENLNNLNNNQFQLNERVSEVEGFLSKQKFSFFDIVKYLGALVGGIIVTWLYLKLGLSK